MLGKIGFKYLKEKQENLTEINRNQGFVKT